MAIKRRIILLILGIIAAIICVIFMFIEGNYGDDVAANVDGDTMVIWFSDIAQKVAGMVSAVSLDEWQKFPC